MNKILLLFIDLLKLLLLLLFSLTIVYLSTLTLNIEFSLFGKEYIPVGVIVSLLSIFFLFKFLKEKTQSMRFAVISCAFINIILLIESALFTGIFDTHYNLIFFTEDVNGAYTVIYDVFFISCMMYFQFTKRTNKKKLKDFV